MIDYRVDSLPSSQPHELIGQATTLPKGIARIPPDTRIVGPDGRPLIIFGRIDQDFRDVVAFLREVKYQKNIRIARMKGDNTAGRKQRTSDATFGYRPQNSIFWNPTGACQFNKLYPKWFDKLKFLGLEVQKEYEKHGSEAFNHHKEKIQAVRPEWRLGENCVFTQGIINNSNALDYHLDRGNFDGVWSCMAVFTHNVKGGELVVPALNLALEVSDHTYVLFDGQYLVHGVAPIRKLSNDAYRFSVVYYSLKLMANCASSEEELKKIRASEMKKNVNRMAAK